MVSAQRAWELRHEVQRITASMNDAQKMDEYARRLRAAWCNPSDEEMRHAVHAFEHMESKFLDAFLERIGKDGK